MSDMGRKIEAPNLAERDWIAANVGLALAMARPYGGDSETTTAPTLPALDLVWDIQGAMIRDERTDPNPLINMVGLAFGQRLVDELGLEWAVVTDEYGTEIAVHGEPGDILVFPTNLVAKRWESGEASFLAKLYPKMRDDILRLRGDVRH